MCDLFLGRALKGDTLVCSLGAGHNSVRTSITRNIHTANFISTLNKIKDVTGLYIIVTASNYDWLEYAGSNTTHENLFVVPNKKTINLTINSHLEGIWCDEWSGLQGHNQTKCWITKPDFFSGLKTNELVKRVPWQVHSIFYWPWLVEKTP